MNLLSSDDLRTLLETRAGWHISMFMPMIQRGAETQQNSIRCKTLLRQAEERLLAWAALRVYQIEQSRWGVRSMPETKQTEPSMEEILASIRRILNEDEPAGGGSGPAASPPPPA